MQTNRSRKSVMKQIVREGETKGEKRTSHKVDRSVGGLLSWSVGRLVGWLVVRLMIYPGTVYVELEVCNDCRAGEALPHVKKDHVMPWVAG